MLFVSIGFRSHRCSPSWPVVLCGACRRLRQTERGSCFAFTYYRRFPANTYSSERLGTSPRVPNRPNCNSIRGCRSRGDARHGTPLFGKFGIAQVEFTLDAAARLVLQLAAAEEIVDPLALGVDQQALDLLVKVAVFSDHAVAGAVVLDVLQPVQVLGANGFDHFCPEVALGCKLVEALSRSLHRLAAGLQLL